MEVKNTMAIESIPIIIVEDDAMGMEVLVELAMDIPDIAVVGEPDTDVVILMPLMPLMPLMLAPVIGIILLSMAVVSLSKKSYEITETAQIRDMLGVEV